MIQTRTTTLTAALIGLWLTGAEINGGEIFITDFAEITNSHFRQTTFHLAAGTKYYMFIDVRFDHCRFDPPLKRWASDSFYRVMVNP